MNTESHFYVEAARTKWLEDNFPGTEYENRHEWNQLPYGEQSDLIEELMTADGWTTNNGIWYPPEEEPTPTTHKPNPSPMIKPR